jgi:hypothetical protein
MGTAMSGLEHSLQADERAALRLQPHPILYLRSTAWAALALIFAAAALFSSDPRWWGLASFLTAGAAACAAVETLFIRRTTALTVTDRRVLLTSGLFRRRFAEAFPAAIAGFEMSQGMLGRACGCASVRVPGLGDAPWLVLPEPERLRSALEALALEVEAAPQKTPEAPPVAATQPEVIERAIRPVNGDARPTPNGHDRGALRPQAELDRF